MCYGYYWSDLDNENNMYKHSYGNRLRKTLVDKNDEVTFFPNLFQPYFSQYENWRDKGLTVAKDCVRDGSDVVIITMDLKRYFYSVDFHKEEFESFLVFTDLKDEICEKINRFVYNVICTYSKKFFEVMYANDKKYFGEVQEGTNILPIGFLPSNILGNVRLNEFDNALVTRWNPVYYGRYVDDIIIVDKVDKFSNLYMCSNLENIELHP